MWSGYADEERVLARARFSIIAGVYSVCVARFLVHLGVALERPAVALESDRRHAGVGAVDIHAAPGSAIIVIRKRRIGLIVLGDKPEVGGKTGRLGSDLAAAGDLLCPWRRWRRATCATSGRDHRARCRHKLVSEIRPDLPAARRVIRTVVRADLRVNKMIVREGDIGEVLRVKGDLEKVGEATVCSATKTARGDRAAVDDVIADHAPHKKWRGIMTVDALGVIYLPLRPALHAGCAAIACRPLRGWVSWLESGTIVGIASLIIAEPNDPNVTIGVGRDPGEEVGMAAIHREAHINWVRPGRALIGRERIEDVGVDRPRGVDKPKVIRGKGWEKIARALILRARRARKDLGVGEGKSSQAQLHVGRDADVNATEGSTRKVLGYTVRGHEDLVQVAAAGATAAIHLDLPGDVGAVCGRHSARSREGLRINCLGKAIEVSQTAVVRALHFDVKGTHIVVVQVHHLSVGAVDPLAVVAGNQRDNWIRRAEAVAARGRMGPRDTRREGQAH